MDKSFLMGVGDQATPGVAHGFYILLGKTSYGDSAWKEKKKGMRSITSWHESLKNRSYLVFTTRFGREFTTTCNIIFEIPLSKVMLLEIFF